MRRMASALDLWTSLFGERVYGLILNREWTRMNANKRQSVVLIASGSTELAEFVFDEAL